MARIMKEQLELTTNKGEWLVVDMPKSSHGIKVFNDIDRPYISYFIGHDTYREYFIGKLHEISFISEITEEQAAEVVECSIHTNLFAHYVNEIPVNTYCYKSSIESLHSLIKSKGYHLFENPYKEPKFNYDFGEDGPSDSMLESAEFDFDYRLEEYNEAETKTLRNPYLFKKI